uniref:Uncharacterized protein n=1 Tax=Arundo donax TaxID=35708 RepID=A0A0A9C5V2_ARUDO
MPAICYGQIPLPMPSACGHALLPVKYSLKRALMQTQEIYYFAFIHMMYSTQFSQLHEHRQ